MVDFHNDLPIVSPEDDLFGYVPFANTIAKCVLGIKEPNGEVIAIYGPWGSGKSSLVNLVCHDVEAQELKEQHSELIVIRFNSWCYRTEDGVISGFFNEIHSKLVDWISEEDNRGSSIDPGLIMDLGLAIYGAVALTQGLDPTPVMEVKSTISKFCDRVRNREIKVTKIDDNKVEDRRIEQLQHEIGTKLRNENIRILVVIDDIDRLSKKEAKMIFRLIKSVGRIMNIMYLLAYDREVTEGMFNQNPESAHYLEKIIQAGFDLPNPNQSTIVEILNKKFEEIFENDISSNSRRTYDIIHDIVVPEMNNLRSINRFINMISVTYQSAKTNVDIADFVALETFRLFRPHLYHAIRSNKDTLTRAIYLPDQDQSLRGNTIAACLRYEPDDIHSRLARALRKLFPSLNEESHKPKFEHIQKWRKKKLVRSKANFDSYFIFSSYEDIITEADLQEFSQIASNKDIVRTRVNSYLNEKVSSGRTKASYLFDRISSNVDSINMDHVESFLSALYSVANECNIYSDSVKEFGYVVNNMDRIRRLSEALLVDRFDEAETSRIMLNACRESSLNFQTHLCVMSWRKYFKSEDFESHDMWTLLSQDDTVNFKNMLVQDIHNSVQNGSIFGYDDFLSILESWQDFADSPTEVRDWFNGAIQNDEYIMKFVQRIKSEFQGILGDSRSMGAKSVLVGKLIDLNNFTSRIHYIIDTGILDKEDKEIAEHVLKLLNSSGQGK